MYLPQHFSRKIYSEAGEVRRPSYIRKIPVKIEFVGVIRHYAQWAA